MGLQTTVGLKHVLRYCIPRYLRMRLAIWRNRQRWIVRDHGD